MQQKLKQVDIYHVNKRNNVEIPYYKFYYIGLSHHKSLMAYSPTPCDDVKENPRSLLWQKNKYQSHQFLEKFQKVGKFLMLGKAVDGYDR